MKILAWLCCNFFNKHDWRVSKSTGLNRHVCNVCHHVEFRHASI
jgi:hypothetical protein